VIDINYQKNEIEKWESTKRKTLARFAICVSYSPMLYVHVIQKKLMLIFLYFFISILLFNIIDFKEK